LSASVAGRSKSRLSPIMNPEGLSVAKLKAWKEMAKRLVKKGKAIFACEVDLTDERGTKDPKVIALALLARSIHNFEAALLLLEHDYVVEARTLMRCCYENLFWIASLLKKGDAFIQKMELDDLASRKKRAKSLLSWADDSPQKPTFAESLKSLSDGFASQKAEAIMHKQAAQEGEIQHAYIFYSELSNDAAHPSATSLSRHITLSDNQPVFTVNAMPITDEAEKGETIDFGCTALLGICAAAQEILEREATGEKLEALFKEFRALSDAKVL
jgi:hypothetical protein